MNASSHATFIDTVPLPPKGVKVVYTWRCSCGAEGGRDFVDRSAAVRGAASHRESAVRS